MQSSPHNGSHSQKLKFNYLQLMFKDLFPHLKSQQAPY